MEKPSPPSSPSTSFDGSRELQCVGTLEIVRPKPVGFLCGSIPVPTDKSFHAFNSALVPSRQTVSAPRYRMLPTETDLNTLPVVSNLPEKVLPIGAVQSKTTGAFNNEELQEIQENVSAIDDTVQQDWPSTVVNGNVQQECPPILQPLECSKCDEEDKDSENSTFSLLQISLSDDRNFLKMEDHATMLILLVCPMQEIHYVEKPSISAENLRLCTTEPNKVWVNTLSKRCEGLYQCDKPKIEVSTFLDIHDIAGLIRGAYEGRELGNSFSSHNCAIDSSFHLLKNVLDSFVGIEMGAMDRYEQYFDVFMLQDSGV